MYVSLIQTYWWIKSPNIGYIQYTLKLSLWLILSLSVTVKLHERWLQNAKTLEWGSKIVRMKERMTEGSCKISDLTINDFKYNWHFLKNDCETLRH